MNQRFCFLNICFHNDLCAVSCIRHSYTNAKRGMQCTWPVEKKHQSRSFSLARSFKKICRKLFSERVCSTQKQECKSNCLWLLFLFFSSNSYDCLCSSLLLFPKRFNSFHFGFGLAMVGEHYDLCVCTLALATSAMSLLF